MKTIKCPLCQHEIDPSSKGCRTGCPMGNDCSLICCPNCRYSFPVPESRILNFLKSIFTNRSGR